MTKQETIEYFYSIGKMPDRYYYQLNGKTAQENYRNQKAKKKDEEKAIEIFVDQIVDKVVQNLNFDFKPSGK